MKGKVYIVGAGPGDPGLITLKALDVIRKAEVVLYDRLVSDEIIKVIPSGVIKEYAGRKVGDDYAHQNETNLLMLKYANDGKLVVRLKGGDPFVFGRGGEEAEFLRENGIDFEIVPGISSAVGSPAYAGIPLTHRSFSSSVAIVTGHEDSEKEEPTVRWRNLASAVDSLVILMGMGRLEHIANELIAGGMDKETPVAIIENGTTDKQRLVLGNLENIAAKVQVTGVRAPAVIVVGKVASLGEKLSWIGARNARR
jgi:uroporphyrin-III C-methyltransferase